MPTVSETFASVRALLPPGNLNFWDDTKDLLPAYNEALDDLSMATEFYELRVSMPRRMWATYHDLRGVLPDEAIRVTAVWNPITGRWLVPTSPRELDNNLGRGWERNIDLARGWWMRGCWWLGIYPKPTDDISPLSVYFSAMAPHIVPDTLRYGYNSTPAIPADFDVAIRQYMLYTLFADNKESNRAVEHYKSYKIKATELKSLVDDRIQNDRAAHMGSRR
jgi:hypothetical protein